VLFSLLPLPFSFLLLSGPRPHLQVHLFPLSPFLRFPPLPHPSIPPLTRDDPYLSTAPTSSSRHPLGWARKLGKKELEKTKRRGKKNPGENLAGGIVLFLEESEFDFVKDLLEFFNSRGCALFSFFPCFIHTVGETLGTGNLRITNTKVETYHRRFFIVRKR